MKLCTSIVVLAALALVPSSVRAACCELRKVDSDASSIRVRVCDPGAASGCEVWIFDAVVESERAAPVCVGGDELVYQAWDASRDDWSPRTEARCEPGRPVEL